MEEKNKGLRTKIKKEENKLKEYLDVLKEYAFIDICRLSVRFENATEEILSEGLQMISKSKLSNTKQFKLKHKLVWGDLDTNKSVTQYLESQLKLTKELSSIAKDTLMSLDDKTKDRIINKCTYYQFTLMTQMKANNSVHNEIEKYQEITRLRRIVKKKNEKNKKK